MCTCQKYSKCQVCNARTNFYVNVHLSEIQSIRSDDDVGDDHVDDDDDKDDDDNNDDDDV